MVDHPENFRSVKFNDNQCDALSRFKGLANVRARENRFLDGFPLTPADNNP